MRVTHVITRLIVGGAQENTIATVLGLRSKPNCTVTLLSGPTSGPEGSLEHEVQDIPGLLTLLPDLIRPVRPHNDVRALRHLISILSAEQPDIVHTHSGKAGFLGRLAAHQAGVPIIIHSIHGPSFGDFQGWLPNFVYRAAERYAARFTTHFVVVAQAMADQYLAAGIGHPAQFTRVWSGFDLAPFLSTSNSRTLRSRWGLSESDFVVGKIARFFELKGHADLFEAAPVLVRHCPRMKFLLVGDGILRGKYESRARALGLESHFVFTGLVSPDEVASLVGIMDVLVHLSRREGLARALPQALAAGKPVVSYDCAGAREVCVDDQTGFLLPPGDIAGLNARLIQLADDPELRLRLGQSGQERVRAAFTVEKMVDDQYALYGKLLTGNSR